MNKHLDMKPVVTGCGCGIDYDLVDGELTNIRLSLCKEHSPDAVRAAERDRCLRVVRAVAGVDMVWMDSAYSRGFRRACLEIDSKIREGGNE